VGSRSNRIHTICVPRGWSPEQAWEAVKRGEELPEKDDSFWVNVETDHLDNFIRIIDSKGEDG